MKEVISKGIKAVMDSAYFISSLVLGLMLLAAGIVALKLLLLD